MKGRRRDPGRDARDEATPGAGLDGEIRSLSRRIAASQELDPPSARTLQRTAGNQATLRHLRDGQPLDGPTRTRMEQAFGTSFAGVRTHTGPEGAQLARGHGAEAFALGEDIVFGEGAYRPGTLMGDVLLAHELAHVAQQRESDSMVQAMPLVGAPSGALEQDANRSALAAVSSLWGGVKANAMPALKSGVRLSKFCGGTAHKMAEGSAGNTLSDSISISITKHERGNAIEGSDPSFIVEGDVTGVDRGIAEVYRLRGDGCNFESAEPPDPVWKVPIVNGKFVIAMPFSATITPAWGQTFMIKAGDGTNYNTACEKVDYPMKKK